MRAKTLSRSVIVVFRQLVGSASATSTIPGGPSRSTRFMRPGRGLSSSVRRACSPNTALFIERSPTTREPHRCQQRRFRVRESVVYLQHIGAKFLLGLV